MVYVNHQTVYINRETIQYTRELCFLFIQCWLALSCREAANKEPRSGSSHSKKMTFFVVGGGITYIIGAQSKNRRLQ